MAERPRAAATRATAAAGAAARRIAVVGTGYVGLPTGACLCSLGHQVICAAVDSGKVSRLARSEVDIPEPGLPELHPDRIVVRSRRACGGPLTSAAAASKSAERYQEAT